MKKEFKGELTLKKLSQGRARFEGIVDGITGLASLIVNAKVLGADYDPAVHDVSGTIVIEVVVKKK